MFLGNWVAKDKNFSRVQSLRHLISCVHPPSLFYQRQQLTRFGNRVASVVPDYQPAWWGWALTPPRRRRMRDACSRCSCPLGVALWGGSLARPPWKARWDRSRRLLLMRWSLPRHAGLSAYMFLHEIIYERYGSRPANKRCFINSASIPLAKLCFLPLTFFNDWLYEK